ncbi:MAG: AIR synthase-related protein [Rhodobacteraceae bacterium]|nr:AIR synthase-related protein [Paracoccaceae bacterium]
MNAVSDALPGDCPLLTKPIGSGTILAAHMMSLASGEELVGALSVMARSAHASAEILGRHANAMTDVSGFGLAGHLLPPSWNLTQCR